MASIAWLHSHLVNAALRRGVMNVIQPAVFSDPSRAVRREPHKTLLRAREPGGHDRSATGARSATDGRHAAFAAAPMIDEGPHDSRHPALPSRVLRRPPGRFATGTLAHEDANATDVAIIVDGSSSRQGQRPRSAAA
jgi:hypothetical protein